MKGKDVSILAGGMALSVVLAVAVLCAGFVASFVAMARYVTYQGNMM